MKRQFFQGFLSLVIFSYYTKINYDISSNKDIFRIYFITMGLILKFIRKKINKPLKKKAHIVA